MSGWKVRRHFHRDTAPRSRAIAVLTSVSHSVGCQIWDFSPWICICQLIVVNTFHGLHGKCVVCFDSIIMICPKWKCSGFTPMTPHPLQQILAVNAVTRILFIQIFSNLPCTVIAPRGRNLLIFAVTAWPVLYLCQQAKPGEPLPCCASPTARLVDLRTVALSLLVSTPCSSSCCFLFQWCAFDWLSFLVMW